MDQPIGIDDMITEIKREIRLRHGVYDRLVREGKLTRHVADRRLDILEAVLILLEERRQPMPTQRSLEL